MRLAQDLHLVAGDGNLGVCDVVGRVRLGQVVERVCMCPQPVRAVRKPGDVDALGGVGEVVSLAPTDVTGLADGTYWLRSEEYTSELQSLTNLVCRLLLEKKKESRVS